MRICNSKCNESKIEDFTVLKNHTIPLGTILLPALLLFLEYLSHTVKDSSLSACSYWGNTSRSSTFNLIILLSTAILIGYFLISLFTLLSNVSISDKKPSEVANHIIICFIDVLSLYL